MKLRERETRARERAKGAEEGGRRSPGKMSLSRREGGCRSGGGSRVALGGLEGTPGCGPRLSQDAPPIILVPFLLPGNI